MIDNLCKYWNELGHLALELFSFGDFMLTEDATIWGIFRNSIWYSNIKEALKY